MEYSGDHPFCYMTYLTPCYGDAQCPAFATGVLLNFFLVDVRPADGAKAIVMVSRDIAFLALNQTVRGSLYDQHYIEHDLDQSPVSFLSINCSSGKKPGDIPTLSTSVLRDCKATGGIYREEYYVTGETLPRCYDMTIPCYPYEDTLCFETDSELAPDFISETYQIIGMFDMLIALSYDISGNLIETRADRYQEGWIGNIDVEVAENYGYGSSTSGATYTIEVRCNNRSIEYTVEERAWSTAEGIYDEEICKWRVTTAGGNTYYPGKLFSAGTTFTTVWDGSYIEETYSGFPVIPLDDWPTTAWYSQNDYYLAEDPGPKWMTIWGQNVFPTWYPNSFGGEYDSMNHMLCLKRYSYNVFGITWQFVPEVQPAGYSSPEGTDITYAIWEGYPYNQWSFNGPANLIGYGDAISLSGVLSYNFINMPAIPAGSRNYMYGTYNPRTQQTTGIEVAHTSPVCFV
jgi:hypothetical protein